MYIKHLSCQKKNVFLKTFKLNGNAEHYDWI